MLVYVTGKIPGVFIDYFIRFQVDFLFTSFLFSAWSHKTFGDKPNEPLGDKPNEPSSRLKKKVRNLTLSLTLHLSWEGCVTLDSRDRASFNGLEEGRKEENKNSVTENCCLFLLPSGSEIGLVKGKGTVFSQCGIPAQSRGSAQGRDWQMPRMLGRKARPDRKAPGNQSHILLKGFNSFCRLHWLLLLSSPPDGAFEQVM